MDIKNLVENLEKVDLTDKYFVLNNEIRRDSLELYFITEVYLNFYELWTIFREIPTKNNDKKIKYSWTFETDDEKYVFVLCDWMNDKNFLQTKRWRILSNTLDDDIISRFLKTLCDALECYNTYYKESVESHTFISDNKDVNKYLYDIKVSLVENKELLKSL